MTTHDTAGTARGEMTMDDEGPGIACNCTDRRRVRCRCGARRGQGHALACPVVMERWAA